MNTKTTQLIGLKAGPADGLGEGELSALVSVYDVKDGDGDIIPAGEYDAWLEDVKAGRAAMPALVYAHDHRNPHAVVGETIGLNGKGSRELPDGSTVYGLEATVRYDLDQPNIPTAQDFARKAFANAKSGRTPQWSMLWEAKSRVLDREKGARILRGLRLGEISNVMVGAASQTATLAVKSGEHGRKAYLEIDVPGSYESVQEAICDALQETYPGGPDQPWANLVATLPDRACYQVDGGAEDDGLFWVDYTIADDGSAELGEPQPTTATLTKSATLEVADDAEDRIRLLAMASEAELA